MRKKSAHKFSHVAWLIIKKERLEGRIWAVPSRLSRVLFGIKKHIVESTLVCLVIWAVWLRGYYREASSGFVCFALCIYLLFVACTTILLTPSLTPSLHFIQYLQEFSFCSRSFALSRDFTGVLGLRL